MRIMCAHVLFAGIGEGGGWIRAGLDVREGPCRESGIWASSLLAMDKVERARGRFDNGVG